MFHFVQNFLGGFRLEVGDQVGGCVGTHFLDDVRGALGVEFFYYLGLQALIEFGDGVGGGFFVERTR